MRLAVNGWFIGKQSTGSGQYLHHLLDHLPSQRPGIEIDVFTPANSYNPIWHDRWPNTNLVPVGLPAMARNIRKLWWEQVVFPRAAGRRAPDVLWVPYWAAPLWQPRPVVVTVHDAIPLLLSDYRGGAQSRAYTSLVTRSARRSAAVLTVSHASARDIVQRLHIPPERVHVVYHGANTAIDSAPNLSQLEVVRQKYHLPAKYFLYLGGYDVRKNVESIVHAYDGFLQQGGDPEIRLVLAGELPMAETAVLRDPRRLIAELGLENRVHLCGWVDETDKPALYALATAFLFPSLYEGFGMMVLEAMAAGTPVITSAR